MLLATPSELTAYRTPVDESVASTLSAAFVPVLAEYVAGLPFAFKMARWRRKAVLKEAVAGRLPRSILNRRKKGFSIPLQSWFHGRLDGLLRETLLSRQATERGYFSRSRIEGLLDEHMRGTANHQAPLFSLLMLELWHRLWIDDPGARSFIPSKAPSRRRRESR